MIDKIKNLFKQKNYEYSPIINIIGIRASTRTSNKFDDTLIFTYTEAGVTSNIRYQITTDPGAYYLKDPLNPKGTAILVPGQYNQAYAIGKHNGKYTALVQVRPVKVYRDNNKDNILNTSVSIEEGLFGINIHRSTPYGQAESIDNHSAGCQVFKRAVDYNFFIKKVQDIMNSNKMKYITYTLITEEDIK